MNRFARSLLCALAACAFALPGAMAADWSKSRKLTADTTAKGVPVTAAVTQLPLLVRLHSGNFTFSEAKPDGSDLRFFAADNKTPLKHFIERWDATNELAVVWVQLPQLAANTAGDLLWMRWGNPQAPAAEERRAVYDGTQMVVLNFSETDGLKDAIGTVAEVKAEGARQVPAGPIGGAVQFDGNGRISLGGALAVPAADGWTLMAWVNPSSTKGSLLSLGNLNVELVDGALSVRQGRTTARATTVLKAGTWQHIAVTAGGGKLAFYVDGKPAGEAAATLADESASATIGAGYQGGIDAWSLARTARSAAYIQASAGSQAADGGLVIFGDGEEGGGGEASYFAILIGAVTLDGWVVIGILGIMAAVSLYVMLTKILQLRRAEKANQVFLDLFREHSGSMLQPGHKVIKELAALGTVQDSSIYRLYSIGISELGKRVPDGSAPGATVTAAALEAIRAALDSAMVRAGQQFNKGIVLLTIAISGGPFLGLLGTVVGVMITFAAIAAAGDVNVNSIAPGIAAALVATVAGLAVAIPALFAYNWFAIRIKNIAADAQVFADEFVTRSAELYTR